METFRLQELEDTGYRIREQRIYILTTICDRQSFANHSLAIVRLHEQKMRFRRLLRRFVQILLLLDRLRDRSKGNDSIDLSFP